MSSRYDSRVLGKNFYVSNDTSITAGNANDAIIGASGSGKTGSILYPTLKMMKNESFILVDSKGLLSKMFKAELEEKGYDVKVISFIHPEGGVGYNPLNYIRRHENGDIRYQDVVTLSRALVPNLDKSEPIWEECATNILQFLISFCLEKLEEADWNMTSVVNLYHVLIKPNGIEYFLDELGDSDSFALKKLLEIQAYRDANKMYLSVLGFVNIALSYFSYPEIQRMLSNQDCIDLYAVGQRKTAIFVQVSDVDRTYDTLVNVFITQALKVLVEEADMNADGKLLVPTRFFLDDMAANCSIPDFDKTISVIRSRDIFASVFLQSVTQLYSKYSEYEAMTIISNCDHVVYMNTNDVGSAEYICNRAQKTMENVLNLDRGKEYVLIAGEKAMCIEKHPAYTDICFE